VDSGDGAQAASTGSNGPEAPGATLAVATNSADTDGRSRFVDAQEPFDTIDASWLSAKYLDDHVSQLIPRGSESALAIRRHGVGLALTASRGRQGPLDRPLSR
jgi:hypothetical protein